MTKIATEVPRVLGGGPKADKTQQEVMDYLFNGLNEKLQSVGLMIRGATLGFNRTMSVEDIFAKLKAAKIV